MMASAIVVFTDVIEPAQLLAKWRPQVPIIVATSNPTLANQVDTNYTFVPYN